MNYPELTAEQTKPKSVFLNVNGQQAILRGRMPLPEFFPSEICRLADKAVASCVVQDLGFVEGLGQAVSLRERSTAQGPITQQLGVWRDSDDAEGPPLHIRHVMTLPLMHNFGRTVLPVQFKGYFPDKDELSVVKLDDLSPEDVTDAEKLQEIVMLNLAANPIEPTEKERFLFYVAVVGMAGEQVPQ